MTTTPQTNTTLAEIAAIIRDNDNFVLCGHVSPDGDCIGSQLTLWHCLRALGKNATCLLVRDEPIEKTVSFLDGCEQMVPVEKYDGLCDVFVGLDVPIRSRIGDAAKLLDQSKLSITIDHHAADVRMCDYAYVDPDSASASMLVWEVVKMLMDEPPLESAVCAYTGLVTDTGGFRFQNSDARAFEVASELVAYGVDPAYVAKWSFQNRTIASLQLEAKTIERMHLIADDDAVISWVHLPDFIEYGATKADAEPLIDCLRSVEGVSIACMLREQLEYVRGSLRSKDDTDVSELARRLGGGGHKAAAGFTVEKPMDEAITLVTESIIAYLKEIR